MIRAVGILGAAALGLAAMPAAAAREPFVAGAAAYEKGTESTIKPQEPAEFAYCAGYWNMWSEAMSDNLVSDDELEPLSAVLQPLGASLQTVGWFTKLKESGTLDAEVEEGRAEARMFLKDALAGDVQAAENLFGTLGACEI